MPCNHKFLEDLTIEYANWKVHTLFIGTFNPGWAECNNNANWFYGRVARNDFWCILPNIHEQISLINGNRNDWIDFCRRNNLAITDIITSLVNVDVNDPIHRQCVCKYTDAALAQITNTKTDVIQILELHPTIKQICFTFLHLPAFLTHWFDELNNWILNHPEREISVIFLYSPSRGARNGLIGSLCNAKRNRWLQDGYQI